MSPTTNIDQAQLAPNSTGLTGGTATATGATTVTDGSCTADTTRPTRAARPCRTRRSRRSSPTTATPTMWTESNGLADHGWLNLKFMPGGYRAPMTASQWITYGPAQTSIQTHATCQNVPALNTDANALAVQATSASDGAGDPFWNYVPWQKTTVPVGATTRPSGSRTCKQRSAWIQLVWTPSPPGGVESCDGQGATCPPTSGRRLRPQRSRTGIYVPADTQGGNQAECDDRRRGRPLTDANTRTAGSPRSPPRRRSSRPISSRPRTSVTRCSTGRWTSS